MVAHASEPVFAPTRHLRLLALRVLLEQPSLDAQLAAGVDPVTSPELALRAGQLAGRRRRTRYARSLRRATAAAETPQTARVPARGPAIPVCRIAVLAARAELLALADDLVELPHARPRGVALTLQLLCDGGGPLYRPWRSEDLREAAEQARAAL
jgi:hypothetical protein